jgi:hypothetical protein
MDSIRVEAAITDNTIPFQPDGNTYQVQEFDKLYITFERKKHKLTAGDFNILTPHKSYFLQFNKRVQGLWLQSDLQVAKRLNNKISFNGSVAKGQFARNIFNGLEGNQGPYKLSGNSGEQFFIVLAGTEKVYIDGVLMQRGEDRDYIINYNTAEVKFMPRQLITKDKRIQVEFEYQDRNYLNSLFHLNDEITIGDKLQIRFNAYSNQDAKNQPYIANFSPEQRQFLRTIGDDIQLAFYKSYSIDTVADASQIRYRITQKIVDNKVYDSVFVYSNSKDSTLYSLNFSYIREQKGNYIISSLNTNGRSYEWVPPVNDIPQGSYEPVILLITPKKHQVLSLGTTYQIVKNKWVNVEVAMSNYDPNLYSSLGQDHVGYATKVQYEGVEELGKRDTLKNGFLSWHNAINYEYVTRNFKAIAPYRNIEFNRDWSIDSSRILEDEHLITFETVLKRKTYTSLGYNFSFYKNASFFNANRHIVTLAWDYNNIRGSLKYNMMLSHSDILKTKFFRPNGFIEKKFAKLVNITLGTSYELDDNTIRRIDNGILQANAFKFDNYSIYLKNDDASFTRVQLKYYTRTDYAQRNNQLEIDNRSQNFEANMGLYGFDGHQINLTGAYRNLKPLYVNSGIQADESMLARIDYQGNFLKNVFQTTCMYEMGTGQEQKREYVYVEVDAGMGMYMWNDYNSDGIQQVNEFELGLFPDQKKYIRTLMMTNEYMKVDYANLNWSFNIQPENIIGRNAKGLQKIVARMSNQLNIQLSNRFIEGLGMNAYNTFYHPKDENMILGQMRSLVNAFYFNRSSTKFGLDYISNHSEGKTLLTYGLERNKNLQHQVKMRVGITKAIMFNVKGAMGLRSYNSGIDDGRTYNIDIYSLEPSLVMMLSTKLRTSIAYNIEHRNNAIKYGGESARIKSATIDMRWSMSNSGVLNAKASYVHIIYSGVMNTSVAYNMLDALMNGKNFLWQVGWNTKLAKSIELSLDYDGRTASKSPIIHTGRMSIRALL